jgi:cytochrome P450 family 142 subfamily A polypeptide 1
MSAIDAPPQDLLDPAWWPDLDKVHDYFTWARQEAPVHRDANGYWIVTKHRDVLDVERRSAVFSSKGSYRANIATDESNMIAQDDPEHLEQRQLVSRRFTPRAVGKDAPFLESRIEELIDAVADAGHIEVVQGLAAQLPSRLTADLLGFPEERWPDIKSWSERLMRTDAMLRDPEAAMGMMSAIMEFNPLLEETSAERKGCPMDDLISVWTEAGYDPMTMMHETGLFIAGGAETTRTAISHGLRAFVDHPDQWEAMAGDPSLVTGAVEEVLRWVTPLNNMFRRAVADATIRDHPIGRGDRIVLLYPSANRDEAVFDEPFRFDIRRSPNPHVAFGFGTHLCIGTHVARTTLAAVFGELSRRITNLRVVAEPDVESNIFARAVRSFRLGFDVR